MRKVDIFILIMIFIIPLACQQRKPISVQDVQGIHDSLDLVQIITDSLYSSNQIITQLTLPKNNEGKFDMKIGFHLTDLKKTSSFAKNYDALAAINGSFFDILNGGSVTYLEMNDTVHNQTNSSKLYNAALVITDDLDIIIEQAQSDEYYAESTDELAVLVSGPILLLNSEKTSMPDKKFVNKRHPRTCLCQTKESLVFITIDGRRKEAEGMNLHEVQNYLLGIGCVDAINLDGGGSTTMWIKGKGIVNFPSDHTGERPVANVLLIY